MILPTFGDQARDVLRRSKMNASRAILEFKRFAMGLGYSCSGRHKHSVIDIYPGVRSDDPRYLRATLQIYEEASSKMGSEFPEFLRPDDVVADFSPLLTVPGMIPDQLGYPPVVLNPPTPSQRWLHFYDAIVRVVVANSTEDRPYTIRNSSGGAMLNITNPEEKFQHTDRMVRFHGKRWLDAFCDDPRTCLTKYRDGRIIINYSRAQADRWSWNRGLWQPKERLVVDWDNYVTGGRVPQDKRLDALGGDYVGRSAVRFRNVNGPTFPTTILLSATIEEDLRGAIFGRYGYTWHHRGRDHIASKAKGKFPVALDISQMDSNVPIEAFTRLEAGAAAKFGNAARLITAWASAVSFTTDPRRDGNGSQSLFTGDPSFRDPRTVYAGLLSGVATNTEIGKFAVSAAILEVAFNAGLTTPKSDEEMDLFLQGRWVWTLLNLGDDSLILFEDDRSRQKFLKKLETGLFKLAPEVPAKFLGFNVVVDLEGRFLDVYPSLGTFLSNELIAEYTYEDPTTKAPHHRSKRARTAPGIGRAARDISIEGIPGGDYVKEIRDRSLRDHLGLTPATFKEWERRELQFYGVPEGGYTLADLHAIEDRTRASWDEAVADSPFAQELDSRKISPETRRLWKQLVH